MNQMPQMPRMPEPNLDSSDSRSELSPFAEDSVVNAAESNVLDTPRPSLANPDSDNASQRTIIVPKKGIEVVAVRKGFYNLNRIKEGTKFFIKSEEQFGEWFKCVDPFFEKKRQEFVKAKKAKK